ncbi:Uncharacterised protein [Shewanella baltica]|nr:Uncharacterised protein [Shewanella baltica]
MILTYMEMRRFKAAGIRFMNNIFTFIVISDFLVSLQNIKMMRKITIISKQI